MSRTLRRRRATASVVRRAAVQSLDHPRPFAESLESRVLLAAVDVLTYRNDFGSTGQNLGETTLTPAVVGNAAQFGKRFATTLDGQVYAEPLVKTGVNITRGSRQGVHNVVYAATQHGSLYAIDANNGQVLWQDSFLNITNPTSLTATSGVSPVGANSTVTNSGINGSNDTVNTNDVSPEVSIIGTPVIDASTNTLYLVAITKEYRPGVDSNGAAVTDRHFIQRLWAVDVSSGAAVASTVIADTVKDTTIGGSLSNYTGYQYFAGPIVNGTGNNAPVNDPTTHQNINADGWMPSTDPAHKNYQPSASGQIAFNAVLQMDRPGISLVNGRIYIGYASHGDDGPYYGWILGYDASTLALTAAFNTCPTFENIAGNRADFRCQAGVWMSGGRISSDALGNLYVTTGNGIFNTAAANFDASGMPIDHDFGDCALKIAVDPNSNSANQNGNGWGLKVVDYFTPSNAVQLNVIDADFGSGGVTVVPDNAVNIPNHPHVMIAGGKEGRIYLIDRDNMGKYNTAYNAQPTGTDPRGFDRLPGEVPPSSGTNTQSNQYYCTGTYFNGRFYIALAKKVGQVWDVPSLAATTIPPGNGFNPPAFQTTSGNISTFGDRGATFTVSANGSSAGIIWAIGNHNLKDGAAAVLPDALLAFDAGSFTTPIFNSGSGTNSLIPAAGAAGVKFSVPTVANGLVFCGTGGVSTTNAAVGLGTIVAYGLLNPPAPPAAPSQPDMTAATDSGSSNTDNVTNDNTPTFTGTAAANSTVTILVDGQSSGVGAANGSGVYTITAFPLGDGPHTVTAIATTLDGASNTSGALNATIDTIRPTLLSAPFLYDVPAQTVRFNFSENVTPTVQVGDLALVNNTTSTTVPTANMAVQLDAGNARANWSFPGYSHGVLPDGNYTATIAAANVADLAGNTPAGNLVTTFFVLGADFDHSRTVDLTDFTILAANFNGTGRPFSQGDANYDGVVDLTVFTILAANFNKTLVAASAQPTSLRVEAPAARVPIAAIASGDIKNDRPVEVLLDPDLNVL
jgi:hypothetical protein